MSTELRYCNLVKQDLLIDTTSFMILGKPLNHSVFSFCICQMKGLTWITLKITSSSLSLYFHDSKDLGYNCSSEPLGFVWSCCLQQCSEVLSMFPSCGPLDLVFFLERSYLGVYLRPLGDATEPASVQTWVGGLSQLWLSLLVMVLHQGSLDTRMWQFSLASVL